MMVQNRRRRGYVVLATAMGLVAMVGMLGLAVDLGRLFIVKSEAQAFADAAAILAATKLNGKKTGIDDAETAIKTSVNKYNFNTQSVPTSALEIYFAKSVLGPWEKPPISSPSGYGFVRVEARPSIKLSFMPTLGAASTKNALGEAVGAQVQQTFPNGGYMPFTPFALNPNDASGNFGMQVGEEYAFLWPGNASQNNSCQGNRVNWPAYNFSDNNNTAGANRGYFELQAASAIRSAIEGATQTQPLNIGDIVNLTNGQKQAMQDALVARALLDTDQTSYGRSPGTAPSYYGNNMRLVIMPINGGSMTVPANKVLGFAAFLLPLSYPNQGNRTWCAIYMGSRVDGGGTSAYPGAGSYVVRLVQ